MATFRKKVLKNGIVAVRIVVKCKDPVTNELKTTSMTWKKPPDMSEYQMKRELQRVSFEFEEKFRNKTQHMLVDGKNIHFDDYAQEWLERQRKLQGVSYWNREKGCVNRAIEYFGHIKLVDITPKMVQNYIDELLEYEIVTEYAKMKPDKTLRLIAKNKKICIKKMKETLGVSLACFEAAHRGQNVNYQKAKEICDAFGVDFDDYFTRHITKKHYAKDTLSKFKKCVSQILKKAKKDGIVEHNFASNDYIDVIKGTKKEITILNDEEARQFKITLDNEPNIRWKTALYILLMMGIRRGELAGLEWKDIDLDKKTMQIQRACYDISGIGVITKDPKTYTSRRILSIPDTLVKVLKEYKEWYDIRKEALASLWKDNDRLFISDDGNNIFPGTYKSWLEKVLKKTNITKHITLHSLRHTNITMQLIAGVDLKTVSSRAGHARASTTTDIYSHFIRSSDNHASKIIDDVFNGNDVEL